MRKLPPLASLRAFEAAARHLSFKRAAGELAVTPTAISHQIRLLEQTLGQKLFERRTRRVSLTLAGQALYGPLRESFDEMARTVERVSASNAASVTLTATMAFASKWLVPRAAGFRSRFPGIDLRLLASDDVVDLRTGAADIAIRYGSGSYSGCRSQPLFQESFAPVCSPGLPIRHHADLADQALIHAEWRMADDSTPTWPRWYAEAGLPYSRTGAHLHFSDETHALQAAIAGHGVALAGMALIANELASGALRVPFGPTLAGHAYQLVVPEDRMDDGRIAAVRDWLAAEAEGSLSTK